MGSQSFRHTFGATEYVRDGAIRHSCPSCGGIGAGTLESRTLISDDGRCAVYRRRACGSCGHRWTTWELSEAQIAEMGR